MLIDTNLCGNLSYDKHIDNENICLPNLEEELVISLRCYKFERNPYEIHFSYSFYNESGYIIDVQYQSRSAYMRVVYNTNLNTGTMETTRADGRDYRFYDLPDEQVDKMFNFSQELYCNDDDDIQEILVRFVMFFCSLANVDNITNLVFVSR